jgi:hypothetical protein
VQPLTVSTKQLWSGQVECQAFGQGVVVTIA